MKHKKLYIFLTIVAIIFISILSFIGVLYHKATQPINRPKVAKVESLELENRINFKDLRNFKNKGVGVNVSTSEATYFANQVLKKQDGNLQLNIQKKIVLIGEQKIKGKSFDYKLTLIPKVGQSNQLILEPISLKVGNLNIPKKIMYFGLDKIQNKLPDFTKVKNNKIYVDLNEINIKYFKLNLSKIDLKNNLITVNLKLKELNSWTHFINTSKLK